MTKKQADRCRKKYGCSPYKPECTTKSAKLKKMVGKQNLGSFECSRYEYCMGKSAEAVDPLKSKPFEKFLKDIRSGKFNKKS